MTQNDKESPQHVEVAREVEGVGPEEDTARGTDTEWETEQPLERCGSGALPEPPCVPNLSFGGEEHADEYGYGDYGHGEAVNRRKGTQRDGTAAAEEFEDDVEGYCGGDVEGDC